MSKEILEWWLDDEESKGEAESLTKDSCRDPRCGCTSAKC